jgi:hypothetical protein
VFNGRTGFNDLTLIPRLYFGETRDRYPDRQDCDSKTFIHKISQSVRSLMRVDRVVLILILIDELGIGKPFKSEFFNSKLFDEIPE